MIPQHHTSSTPTVRICLIPKIPQKDRGYARYSRCGLAEVRQFTYLLTYCGGGRADNVAVKVVPVGGARNSDVKG